ncbi:hypothetical protein BpHYR1_006029 [Brachionus plicatilis]|uniref:Uncharacterized protein n=1 Tax=Brachionus plicatilis TaxID=10195 RepID=A0A3M7PXI5_BRAPC|nr:hypothetical protein BpHYR1_006029 [Brachionus plicatilis]
MVTRVLKKTIRRINRRIYKRIYKAFILAFVPLIMVTVLFYLKYYSLDDDWENFELTNWYLNFVLGFEFDVDEDEADKEIKLGALAGLFSTLAPLGGPWFMIPPMVFNI